MYLLDINHCSRIIAGDRTLIQQLQAHEGDRIATSAIVQGELHFMVQKSERQSENQQAVERFLQGISLYPISGSVANAYGKLKGDIMNRLGPKNKAKRRKATVQSLGFSDNDLWIAATVLHYNLTLVSRDEDFQRLQIVQSFSVESWL